MEGVSRVKIVPDENDLRDNIEKWREREYHSTLLTLKHQFGLCGYSISPIGAKKLLELCLPINNNPISFEGYNITVENRFFDCSVNFGLPKINAFVCVPPLAVTARDKTRSSTARINNEGEVSRDSNSDS